MRKLFQWHRGGLKESVETQVEVTCFADIEKIVARHCEDIHMPNVYYNLTVSYAYDDSDRLGDEWKETYYVKAKVMGEGRCVLGYCNFSEENC